MERVHDVSLLQDPQLREEPRSLWDHLERLDLNLRCSVTEEIGRNADQNRACYQQNIPGQIPKP